MSLDKNSIQSFDPADELLSLSQRINLTPQPRILLAISKALRSSQPSFQKINDLLYKDAALSAKVLKLVNSPMFSPEKKIDSIERALTRLGLLNFYTVVLSSCLKAVLSADNKENEQLWKHTQIVSGLCRKVAETW